MMRALSSVLALTFITSGCITVPNQSFPFGEPLSLVSIDGRPAGDDSFVLELAEGGTYSARYACASHFGNYTVSATILTLMPAASTGGQCDQQDISTGGSVNSSTANADRFFTGESLNFSISGKNVTFNREYQVFIMQPER